jgi:hypothetical protein
MSEFHSRYFGVNIDSIRQKYIETWKMVIQSNIDPSEVSKE